MEILLRYWCHLKAMLLFFFSSPQTTAMTSHASPLYPPSTNKQKRLSTFFCVFCENPVSLSMESFESFTSHMQVQHGIFFEYEILLSIHFISKEEKANIIKEVSAKMKAPIILGTNNSFTIELCSGQSEISSKTNISESFDKLPSTEFTPSNVVKFSTGLQITELGNNKNDLTSTSLSDGIETFKHEPLENLVRLKDNYISKGSQTSFEEGKITEVASKDVNDEGRKLDLICNCNCPKCQKCKQNIERKSFKCHKCEREFQKQRSLYHHNKFNTFCTESKQCTKCGKTFVTVENLKEHFLKKYSCDKKDRVCGKCGTQFNYPSQFALHIKGVLSGKECSLAKLKRFKCRKCKRNFGNNERLWKHEMSKYGCEQKCPDCGKSFKQHQNLQRHMRDDCDTKYKCTNCLKTFIASASLMNHNNSEVKCERKTVCEKCGVKVLNLNYEKHIKDECVAFECATCGECFYHKMTFKRHIHNHIKEERKLQFEKETYICTPCDITFDNKPLFEQHQHQHSIEQPTVNLFVSPQKEQPNMVKFGCGQCDYESIQKGMLLIHQKVKHNGVVSKCEQCEFQSGYPNSIIRHMRKVHKLYETTNNKTELENQNELVLAIL